MSRVIVNEDIGTIEIEVGVYLADEIPKGCQNEWRAMRPQVDAIIADLVDDPWTRRAVVSLWPWRWDPLDWVPCFVAFQFLLRGGTLTLLVFQRSSSDAERDQDMAFFRFLIGYVRDALSITLGRPIVTLRLVIFRGSEHIVAEHIDGGGC